MLYNINMAKGRKTKRNPIRKTNRKPIRKLIRKTKRKTKNNDKIKKKLKKYHQRSIKLKSVSTQDELFNFDKPKKSNTTKRMFYANLYKNMQNKDRLCHVMNIDNEVVSLPKSYPGDEWVHANLIRQPDRHIESFESDYFKEQYNRYRQMCVSK